MTGSAANQSKVYWLVAIGFTILISFYSTIYSLTHGIDEVFPFFYFLPIILFVYFYPHRGVIFSLIISTIFLLLVYYFSNNNPNLVAVSTAWFVIFITIGVVTSSFAEGLKAEEKKYLGIFENSQAGIFTFNLVSLRILEMNGKCALMLRHDRKDLIDKDLSRILVDSVNRDLFITEIKSHPNIGERELLFHIRGGAVRQFLVSASRTEDDIVICSAIDVTERKLAERVIQKARDDLEHRVRQRTNELLRANDELKAEIQVITLQDITERKHAEEVNTMLQELQESQIQLALQSKQLAEANRKANLYLDIYLDVLTYEIMNAIFVLSGYADILKNRVGENEKIYALRMIETIKKSRYVIRNIETISKIYKHPPEQKPTNLGDVITKEINANTGINIRCINCNFPVLADEMLQVVFQNLLSNSIKSGGSEIEIDVSVEDQPDGMVLVSLTDTGKGIPDDMKPTIFDRFMQGSEKRSSYGLGLHIAKMLIEAYGGKIWADDRVKGHPEQGAAIRFTLKKG